MADLRSGPWIAALSVCAGVAACSSTSDEQPATSAGVGSVTCTTDSRVQPFSPGMAEEGTRNAFKFVLVSTSAVTGVPSVDTEAWTMKVLDASGQAVTDATFSALKAWMPDHQHGWTSITSKANGDGTYTLGNIYFFMSGVWQLSMTAASGTTLDSTTFPFCIGG